jgi:hypothetical protein
MSEEITERADRESPDRGSNRVEQHEARRWNAAHSDDEWRHRPEAPDQPEAEREDEERLAALEHADRRQSTLDYPESSNLFW